MLDNSGYIDKVVFDLSLARGLDYYTGFIFEAVFKGATQAGSIAAGGRYDNLISQYGSKSVAAVGVSLGIERVLTIMEQNQKNEQGIRATETEVLVSIRGNDESLAAKLVSMCRDAKLKAEAKIGRGDNQMKYAEECGIPWVVIVGEREIKQGTVRLLNMETQVEKVVSTKNFVDELIRLIDTPQP